MSLNDKFSQHRDLGLDLVRFFSFLAILYHHFTAVVWYSIDMEVTHNSFIWRWTENYSRVISFSGQTILFLSSFLIGRAQSHPQKTWKIVFWSLMGWIVFCFFEYSENHFFWIWDIYPLLFFSLALSVLFSQALKNRSSWPYLAFAGLGFLMTTIKFWEWTSLQNNSLMIRSWLIGDCATDFADWPFFPWSGLIFMGYGLGKFVQIQSLMNGQKVFSKWKKIEYLIWPVLFFLSIPFVGAYYKIQLGPMFGCFVFRQEPFIFWSSFIYIIFFCRLSLLSKVNQHLEKLRFVVWVSRLKTSTHFGLIYLTHYTVIELFKHFQFKPYGLDAILSYFVFLTVLPISELIVTGLTKLAKNSKTA